MIRKFQALMKTFAGGEDKKVLDCSNTQCVKIKCLIKELTRGITKSMVTLEVLPECRKFDFMTLLSPYAQH